MSEIGTDIAIIGGGLGGAAAALAACEAGRHVVLTEESDWIGGQITSQGVSALDEHPHIETFSGTQAYARLRQAIRAHYGVRNPGNGWVSRLCFAPRVGLAALESMLAPHIDAGRLTILRQRRAVSADVSGGWIRALTLDDGTTIRARCCLDATDTGDLLPLTDTACVTGAESQEETGEQDAPLTARPDEMQSFTVCFAVEYVPNSDHASAPPPDYAANRAAQPYSLTLTLRDGSQRRYRMFGGELPFWTYRRIHDGAQLGGNDITLINWASNDYYGSSLLTDPDALDKAKRLSLGFLHWLHTECPRDDGGVGYPELRLRPDVMGTADGLAKSPYVRESRRIRALTTICAHDIAADAHAGARARWRPDSVGVGWYAMDLHPCVGSPQTHLYTPTLPFQIPLGALIPQRTHNLLPACKNIGTTHLTNGACRVHPVEWAVGEAAGTLAAFVCAAGGIAVQELPAHRAQIQRRLLERGVALAWAVDIPPEHPLFIPTQYLLLHDARLHSQAPLAVLDDPAWAQRCLRLSEQVTQWGR